MTAVSKMSSLQRKALSNLLQWENLSGQERMELMETLIPEMDLTERKKAVDEMSSGKYPSV